VCVCVTCVAPKKEKLNRCVRKGKSQKLRDLRMNGPQTKEGREAGLVVSRLCDFSPSRVSYGFFLAECTSLIVLYITIYALN